jgi:hypothetical protein
MKINLRHKSLLFTLINKYGFEGHFSVILAGFCD